MTHFLRPVTRAVRRAGRLMPVLLVVGLAACDRLPWRDQGDTSGSAPAALPERTPLEEAGYDTLTSHEAMMSFLEALDRASPRVTLRELGTSVGERSIPYLEVSTGSFGDARDERLMLLVYAQQHGNEPSGKEAALALALALARGDHDALLERVDVLLVPMVNPDGAEAHRRTNDPGIDLNRSHLILDGPEVVHLRELFHRWEPEVAVDVHEYDPWSEAWLDAGWLRLWDVQIGLPTNLNTDPDIRQLAEEGFLPHAVAALESAGFSGHNYVVGSPERLRWSTTNPNDGRQGLALLHTLSFIFEGKRSEPLATDMERRSSAQLVALEALLRYTAEAGPEIRRVVRGARERAARGEIDRVILTMDRGRDPSGLEIPVLAVTRSPEGTWAVGDTVQARVENWYPEVREGASTALPHGYLVPRSEAALIELLQRHQVEVGVLEVPEAGLEVERLRIVGFGTELLEAEQSVARVSAAPVRYDAQPGDALVLTAQPRGLLAAVLLEPGSMHGVLNYEAFRHLAREGDYPVMRLLR
jgi:hypothetical protein